MYNESSFYTRADVLLCYWEQKLLSLALTKVTLLAATAT